MKLLTRGTPRACVALTLILTLLGLGALDAAVCQGSDGHSGIKTNLNSCCRLAAPRSSSTSVLSPHAMTVLGPAGMDMGCQDTPLIQRALAMHADDFPAGCPGPSITVPGPLATGSTHPGPAPLFREGSSLGRLRSTTLLI